MPEQKISTAIVIDGDVDFAALDGALEPVEPYTHSPHTIGMMMRHVKWWEYPVMGLVGALLGAAVFFASPALGVI